MTSVEQREFEHDMETFVDMYEGRAKLAEPVLHIKQQTNGAEPAEITPYWVCEKCTTVNGLDKVKCLGCHKVRSA